MEKNKKTPNLNSIKFINQRKTGLTKIKSTINLRSVFQGIQKIEIKRGKLNQVGMVPFLVIV